MNNLERIAECYRHMPNGGAALNIGPTGDIGNGMVIVARFPSPRAAFKALRDAGFVRTNYGWKLRDRI